MAENLNAKRKMQENEKKTHTASYRSAEIKLESKSNKHGKNGYNIKRNKNTNKLTIETREVRKTSICIKNKRHTKHRTRPCV